MRHVLPKSLFGRLVLVLLTGLLGTLLLSAGILFQDRAYGVYAASGLHSAQRFADIIRLLDSVEPEQRQRFIEVFNSPDLRLAISEDSSLVSIQESPDRGPAAIFRALVERSLPGEQSLGVTVTERRMRQRAHAPMRHHHPPRGPDMAHRRHMRRMGVLPPEDVNLFAQIQLRDGSWLSFQQRLPQDLFAWPQRLLVTLALLLASVVLLSVIAVRWASRPLSTLADAAEKLGRDMRQPPLQISGPSEVRRAALAFNTMQARLVRFVEDRTRILSALSHDLKTPITRLCLRAELIADTELQASVNHDLDDMQRMTKEALDFLRGMEDTEKIQSIDIPALLENVKDDVEETGGEVRLVDIEAAPYPGRPLALKRGITNLIENACKYGKRAHVSIHDSLERLEIVVADEGPGIPDAERTKVFEPFYRMESSRNRDTGGTGLGLSLARNIARAHGGDLVVRNRDGGGLEAWLTLPR